MAENKLQEAYRALQELAKNGDQRAIELLGRLEKTEAEFLNALDQSYAKARGRRSKDNQNLPQQQEKQTNQQAEHSSTLDWARERFAQMSPEEQAKTEAAFLKLTRSIID